MKCEQFHPSYEERPKAEVIATLALSPTGELLSLRLCRWHGNRLADIVLTAPRMYQTWRAFTELPDSYYD